MIAAIGMVAQHPERYERMSLRGNHTRREEQGVAGKEEAHQEPGLDEHHGQQTDQAEGGQQHVGLEHSHVSLTGTVWQCPAEGTLNACHVRAGTSGVLAQRRPEGWEMRVLVVEDEVRLAETIRRGLVSEGFVVDVEHRGDDGFHTAVSDDFDAIILDIMLPGKNGYELVRELRAQDVWTPVLMLSAKDGEYDLADAFDLGADDYLVKPFSFVVLFARLRALVRRGAPERPAVLTVGDIELDPARHKVTRAGTELTLTPREYSVLEFLMRHRDKVVSKGEIVRSVWDTNYDGDENIVEVYVGYLRRKIDLPFSGHSIETVRGVGYRFVGG